jgi:hypothetical protein
MLTVFKRRREEAISVPDIWALGQPAFKLKRDNLVFRLGVKAKDVRACEECYAQENKATAARYPSAERKGKRLCLQHARDANIHTAPTKTIKRTLLDSRFLKSFQEANPDLDPADYSISSRKEVQWKCQDCPHTFKSACYTRENGCGCPYCSKRVVCGKEDCEECFERSLASSIQAGTLTASFHLDNVKTPLELTCSSNIICKWTCLKCMHVFDKQCNDMSAGYGCPYCCVPRQKLCDDEKCQACFDGSLASSEHVDEFMAANNNGANPRKVALASNKEYNWKCNQCLHTFLKGCNTVKAGHFCQFCSKRAVCGQEGCDPCKSRSLAVSPRASNFHPDNGVSLLTVALSSNDKYKWTCNDCEHVFLMPCNAVQRGAWCHFCSKRYVCGDEECWRCYSRCLASFSKSEYFHPDNGVSPYTVCLGSNERFKWSCDKCPHEFEATAAHVALDFTWCPYCSKNRICCKIECDVCPLPCFLCEYRSFFTLTKGPQAGSRVCYSHYLASGEARATLRLEHFTLTSLQNVAKERELYEFQECTSWDCAILPGLGYKPDMLWAFSPQGDMFATAGACKLNLRLIEQIIILEVLEVGINQHSAARRVSDVQREAEIRQSLQGVIIDFVYVVVAAYNHASSHPEDRFFKKYPKRHTYGIEKSRVTAWGLRMNATLEALSLARTQKSGKTVYIGH